MTDGTQIRFDRFLDACEMDRQFRKELDSLEFRCRLFGFVTTKVVKIALDPRDLFGDSHKFWQSHRLSAHRNLYRQVKFYRKIIVSAEGSIRLMKGNVPVAFTTCEAAVAGTAGDAEPDGRVRAGRAGLASCAAGLVPIPSWSILGFNSLGLIEPEPCVFEAVLGANGNAFNLETSGFRALTIALSCFCTSFSRSESECPFEPRTVMGLDGLRRLFFIFRSSSLSSLSDTTKIGLLEPAGNKSIRERTSSKVQVRLTGTYCPFAVAERHVGLDITRECRDAWLAFTRSGKDIQLGLEFCFAVTRQRTERSRASLRQHGGRRLTA